MHLNIKMLSCLKSFPKKVHISRGEEQLGSYCSGLGEAGKALMRCGYRCSGGKSAGDIVRWNQGDPEADK